MARKKVKKTALKTVKINTPKKPNRFIFWTPRILLILFALFLVIFSFDIFDSATGLSEILLGLFMHNIPSMVLIAILIVSWKHDLVGALIFMALGTLCVIGAIISLLMLNREATYGPMTIDGIINPMWIIGSVVFFIIGGLFLAGWHEKKKV